MSAGSAMASTVPHQGTEAGSIPSPALHQIEVRPVPFFVAKKLLVHRHYSRSFAGRTRVSFIVRVAVVSVHQYWPDTRLFRTANIRIQLVAYQHRVSCLDISPRECCLEDTGVRLFVTGIAGRRREIDMIDKVHLFAKSFTAGIHV